MSQSVSATHNHADIVTVFTYKIFPDIPNNSLTTGQIPDISLTNAKIPDISRFFRKVFTVDRRMQILR